MAYTIIRTEKQYNEYCDDLHELVRNVDSRESDDVELITLLTQKWEQENITCIELDPIQIIKELMVQNNINSKDLGEILELSKGTISKMLNYNKGLSKDTIRKISQRFKISQAILNKPYKLKNQVNRSSVRSPKNNSSFVQIKTPV